MTAPTAPTDPLAVDRASREELLELPRDRLRDLLRHATAHSSYCRDLLGADAVDAPLGELPTLTKATLVEQFDRIVTDPRLTRKAVAAHASGPQEHRRSTGSSSPPSSPPSSSRAACASRRASSPSARRC